MWLEAISGQPTGRRRWERQVVGKRQYQNMKCKITEERRTLKLPFSQPSTQLWNNIANHESFPQLTFVEGREPLLTPYVIFLTGIFQWVFTSYSVHFEFHKYLLC